MVKVKANRYYTVTLKDGRNRRRIHGANGRIIGWEDVEDFDKPKGEYRIKEYVFTVRPTKGNNIKPVDWEIKIHAPEGYEDSLLELLKTDMEGFINEEFINMADITIGKQGIDFIEWSDRPYISGVYIVKGLGYKYSRDLAEDPDE